MPIEYTITISVISVICTVIGVSIGMSNLRRNTKIDPRQAGFAKMTEQQALACGKSQVDEKVANDVFNRILDMF